jgi:hypothetical protein
MNTDIVTDRVIAIDFSTPLPNLIAAANFALHFLHVR